MHHMCASHLAYGMGKRSLSADVCCAGILACAAWCISRAHGIREQSRDRHVLTLDYAGPHVHQHCMWCMLLCMHPMHVCICLQVGQQSGALAARESAAQHLAKENAVLRRQVRWMQVCLGLLAAGRDGIDEFSRLQAHLGCCCCLLAIR